MAKFINRIDRDNDAKRRFEEFKITHISKIQNRTVNTLVKIARDFHKNLVFVGYFTPVTLNLSNVIVFMSKKKIC